VAKNLLFLAENGTALQVRRGSLCVRDTEGTETLYPARVHGLRSIIMAGRGGSLTDEAIRWAGREGVALYLMCLHGEGFAVIGEAMETDHRRSALTVRQKQFGTVLSPRKRLEVARKIVGMKLRTLRLDPVDAREFRQELAGARKLDEVLITEARAGAAYFMRWRSVRLRIRGEVPDHWKGFVTRAGSLLKGRGGMSRARHAATPLNAMLNYVYIVALGQCTRACIGLGLDPCHGYLHAPKRGRMSLSYDVLELHRADLTSAVFAHAARTSFAPDAFELNKIGVVSLSPAVARDMAALALRVASITECVKSVRRVLSWL
jgi:CRISPR-associated protein Cas1